MLCDDTVDFFFLNHSSRASALWISIVAPELTYVAQNE